MIWEPVLDDFLDCYDSWREEAETVRSNYDRGLSTGVVSALDRTPHYRDRDPGNTAEPKLTREKGDGLTVQGRGDSEARALAGCPVVCG